MRARSPATPSCTSLQRSARLGDALPGHVLALHTNNGTSPEESARIHADGSIGGCRDADVCKIEPADVWLRSLCQEAGLRPGKRQRDACSYPKPSSMSLTQRISSLSALPRLQRTETLLIFLPIHLTTCEALLKDGDG